MLDFVLKQTIKVLLDSLDLFASEECSKFEWKKRASPGSAQTEIHSCLFSSCLILSISAVCSGLSSELPWLILPTLCDPFNN